MTELDLSFSVERIEVFLFRAPANPPIETSFGFMRDRPAVLLKVSDADGVFGWGEIWCNFPLVGAEHRARMAAVYLRPMICGKRWPSPQACFQSLSKSFEVLALQCGEPGPLNQIVAGLDVAIWDMVARRADIPLWQALQGGADALPNPIEVYASGLNPTKPEKLTATKLKEGYRAFKLKVGFGAARDDANLHAIRDVIGAGTALMVDANQAWNINDASDAGRRMEHFDLAWLEEPMRADVDVTHWSRLANEQPLALAGGENLYGFSKFETFMATPGISVVQPDLGKWGGFSGCLEVGRSAQNHGRLFCPHWLGGGIGLTASFHLKAAIGGAGYVEVDANPNPLRELLARPKFALRDGAVQLGRQAGLGVRPDLTACRKFLVELPGL